MSTILLPLVFSNLSIVQHTGAIREAVRICVEKDIKLTISVRCDEIRKHQDKLDTIWSKIQQFLSALYVVQLTESYHQNRPLFPCDIIFEDVCGYPVYLEPTIEGVCILPQQQDDIKEWNKARKDVPFKEYHLNTKDDEDIVLKEIEDRVNPRVFQRVAVGGTFDHIHAGHKILLTMTALLALSSVVVGVTDDIMLVKKKHRELIIPIDQRIQQVKTYLYNTKRNLTYDVVPITDPYGPTITDPTIDGIVVSKETLKGGHMVNDERKVREYPLLEIRIIDVISSDNAAVEEKDMDALKLSSSWIRNYLATK